jgi:hypothetical protein
MNFIIIAATGRSGSTTLQRIINSIPDSNITGEKWGAIEDLLNCYKNIKETTSYSPKNNDDELLTMDEMIKANIKPAWYNCFYLEEVKNNIKNTIISILVRSESISNYRIIGYKEIRFFNKLHLLDEFVELFPNTKIICHLSDNLERQCKSDWWKLDENSKQHLLDYNNQLINYASNKDNCYLSYMKNLFDIDEVEKMFLFLGEKLNKEEYDLIISNSLE